MPPIFMDIFLEGFNADDTSKIVDTSNSSIIIFVGYILVLGLGQATFLWPGVVLDWNTELGM